MSVPSSGPQSNGRTQVRQDWQGHERFYSDLLSGLYRHRLKLFWTMLLFAALALFAWMIWLLLYAPKRTPFVVFSAAPYTWPLPPNAWATEDIDKLAALDGQNISMLGAEDPVLSKAGFLDRLEQDIGRSDEIPSSLPLVIYVSLHGIGEKSDEAEGESTPPGGRIHLIPPQASPTDATTWIHFDELAEQLAKLPAKRNTLLILDCQRMQVNWNIGLTENQFAQQLQLALSEGAANQLAVLLSAGLHEQAHVSSDFLGSTFGHYLRQGLAGAADSQVDSGNQDGWVSLVELHSFLQSRLDRWTAQNRGAKQTPLLLTSQTNLDFRLTKSLGREKLERLLEEDRKSSRPAPSIAADRLDPLWRQLDELRGLHLYQHEPLAWRNLEHRLLWLEQLSSSGVGYRSLAMRTFDDVERQLEGIQVNMQRLRQTRSVRDSFSVISEDAWPLPRPLRLHTMSLAEYFGTQAEAVSQLRAAIDPFRQQPNPVTLAATLSSLEKDATEFAEGQFLRMLGRYQFPSLWEPLRNVGQILQLQTDLHDLAVPRDANGLPANEAVHAWTCELVSRVQPLLRQAEDSLFVEGQSALAEQLNETRAAYLDAAAAIRLLHSVNQACDRALAETPYLAQWLTHPLHAENPLKTQETVDNRLLPLIHETQQLSRELSSIPNDTAELASLVSNINRIQGFANDKVIEPWELLLNEWQTRCQQLFGESETDKPHLVGELEAVLSVPLVPWETRRDLRLALNRMTARLHENYDDGQLGADGTADRDAAQNLESYGTRMQSWSQHPLLAILEQPAVPDDRRNPISVALGDIAELLQQQSNATSLAAQREIASQAASRFRAAAPLWFAAPPRDPVVELCQFDLQSLLIWQAQSSLDDFWGPAGQDRAFFDVAVSDYLAAATGFSRLRQPADAEARPAEIESLTARLEASRQIADTWITTQGGSTVQLSSSDSVLSSIRVKALPAEAISAAADFLPPSGVAAVFVRGPGGRLAASQFEPSGEAVVPGADREFRVTLPPDVARADDELQALTMFRGHEYMGQIKVEALGGLSVDLRPYRYDFSEVTLNSPWQKLSVGFVLDCSHSMQNPLDGGGEDGASPSRLDVAKLALQELLFNLSLRRNVRVGVHVFGHRLGWSTDTPIRPLTRPDLTEVVDGVTPSQDVESVLPLVNFNLSAAQAVIPRISSLKAWGQSPLYLSVVQALSDFGSGDADADRHIIVITDGANYQYIPTSESGVQATTADDVRQAWAASQVPVHILGLGMDRTQDRAAIQEFEQLCADTGGRFQALTRSVDLTAALKELLGPGTYRLASQEAQGEPDRESPLGSPIRVSPAPKATQQFWLSYEGRRLVDTDAQATLDAPIAREDIWFQGGESMQLFVNADGDAIQAYPYQENVAAEGRLITSQGAATDYVVRVHRPTRESQGHVTIPISWQRLDRRTNSLDLLWRVSRRPAEMWVEVQPMSAFNAPVGQPYTFFDANYEPKQPVPLMNLVARNWPASAVKAQIQLWCQPPAAASLELPTPSNALRKAPSDAKFKVDVPVHHALQSPVEITSGVTLRLDPPNATKNDHSRQQRFVLSFNDDGLPVSSIKLSYPEAAGARPSRILRQFDSRHRMAVHTFYFDDPQAELPAVIEISNRAYELDWAWQLEAQSLTVDLAESGDFLPVTGK